MIHAGVVFCFSTKHLSNLPNVKSVISCLLLFTSLFFAQPPQRFSAEQLIAELGCAPCHSGLNTTQPAKLKESIPDLSQAGLRYNPAYLFDYLRNPSQVRPHIWPARMPDFHFSESEALALTLFLETQTYIDPRWPDFPNELKQSLTKAQSKSPKKFEAVLADSLICLNCHTFKGKGGRLAPELSNVGYRLKAEWVKKFLAAPNIFGVPASLMPAQFYKISRQNGQFMELLPVTGKKIFDVTESLFALGEEKREKLKIAFGAAKTTYPEVKASTGKQIFLSQNCVACHRHSNQKSLQIRNLAPDLSLEGSRVKGDWLNNYLIKPTPVRPFGYLPGSGSRMPDFNLSDEEVKQISVILLKQKGESEKQKQTFQPQKVSAFSSRKAFSFLQHKLSCLGCHRLGKAGGRIGPDLSNISKRLQPSFVYKIVKDPASILPHTIMPKVTMPPKTLNLIVNFLLQQNEQPVESAYLSLTGNPIIFFNDHNQPESRYRQSCAPCHGRRGDGNGFNARYLAVRPTIHSDKNYMEKRPDDTLFDGVFAGGYILNKSHLMPPWGETLSRLEIKALVFYMRELCGCQGPEWSRDGN